MKVEKEKHRVSIICQDGSSVKGIIHINPGERILDYINHTRESFIAVTNAEFYYIKDIKSFKLVSKLLEKKDYIILNKSSIKLIVEI